MDTATLTEAQRVAADVLANVSQDQLDLPTPCAKWNVAQLIDHLIGAQYWATAAMQGTDMTQTGDGLSSGDFNQAFADASSACAAEFLADGALDRTVNPGFGDMPAPALLGMAATDTFTHAWDLATATSQSNDLDPALADVLLANAKASVQDAFRSDDGAIYGPEQSAPAGASPAAQLAAFLGRTA